jgi:REP element-mobilizing transposase RayT
MGMAAQSSEGRYPMRLPRFHIAGQVYYITTVVYNRLRIFTRPSFIVPLFDSLNFYRYKQSFKLLGYVIMPDHIHLLIWPYGKSTVSEIMRDYKEFTAKRVIRQAEVEGIREWVAAFQRAGEETGRSENKVWQDSYWDVNVYTESFLRQKLNYMHENPIRVGLVKNPAVYPYSSYRNYELGEEWMIQIDQEWA